MMIRHLYPLVVAALFLADSCTGAGHLPRLNIDLDRITVSGVSSGGAFAIQFHVAFSSSIVGLGAFAAPPYWCAQGDIDVAISSCMSSPELISVADLIAATTYAAITDKSIDNPANLKSGRVWIWTGTADTVVHSGVVAKTNEYYENYVSKENILFHNSFPAEHSWVTDHCCNPCGHLGTPFINDCGFDAAGEMLNHLYHGTLVNRTTQKNSSLVRFSQEDFTPGGAPTTSISMAGTGYAYIPTACYNTATKCLLHVVFHGCLQGDDAIGDTFVRDSGLNDWAEVNNMVILYPQARKSQVVPYNPKGCWDWWGYDGLEYATQYGAQMVTVKNMISRITGSFGSQARA